TELTHMRQGQEATVDIDTYPDAQCHGKVVSLSPGTGLAFSLLPPENATGNWVKVVQRLPVRLSLECTPSNLSLHAGLSATVEVDTKYRRPWLAWVSRTADRLVGTAQAGETAHRRTARRHDPPHGNERRGAALRGGQAAGPAVPNRAAITASIMLATFMQGVDTTITNVALPHMQGSLSASQDQIAWVVTSYIVAAAIMTPLTGWLAGRF